MGKRIVFVSIFDLTEVFYRISEALRQQGHDIFWITTNEVWTHWLLEQGVNRNDIKQLVYSSDDFLDNEAKQKLLPEIVASEHNAGLTINQSMMMDQFITRKNKPNINDYLFLYYRDIKAFLSDKQATHLVAEPTNSNEIVAYMICRELGVEFVSPRDIRYPANRFIFFDSYLQENPLIGDGHPDVSGKELIEAFAQKKPAPHYFNKFSRLKAFDPGKVTAAARNRRKRRAITSHNSLTHHDLKGRVSLAMAKAYNGFYLRHICRYDSLDDIKGKIAFFGLHVQPEASIDVLGSYFSDQLKLIKDIRRSLPFDTTLVVKEHPNFLGIKKIAFFREIRRIPNVALIKHDVSTFEVYKRAQILFTVSGTIGYEGGMLGIPVITFCPIYFNGFSSVHSCTDLTTMQELVYYLLHDFKRDYEADCAFMDKLIEHSHPGFWSDPIFYPRVLSEENIAKLQTAFLKVIDCVGD